MMKAFIMEFYLCYKLNICQYEEEDCDYIFSNRIEMPCPPPIQAEPMPYFTPSRLSLCTRWADIRAPEAARG